MIPNAFNVPMVKIQIIDCTANKKKFKLKSYPDKTYLLVTVIKIDEAQYDKIDTGAELAIELIPEYDDLSILTLVLDLIICLNEYISCPTR